MREGFVALALHRPNRPENIGGVFRAADVYGVRLVVLGGGELPPGPLGHRTIWPAQMPEPPPDSA